MATGRSIGVAVDLSNGSKLALQWTTENILDKGDTLYVIHVKPYQGDEPSSLLWSATGSPLIPYSEFRVKGDMHKYEVDLDPEILGLLEAACNQKEVTVVGKIYWGDAREKLLSAVTDLKLDCLIMGSRGLGTIKRVLMGSVSSYVVANALCPVTIVKDQSSH